MGIEISPDPFLLIVCTIALWTFVAYIWWRTRDLGVTHDPAEEPSIAAPSLGGRTSPIHMATEFAQRGLRLLRYLYNWVILGKA